jgi:hypothetical protein
MRCPVFAYQGRCEVVLSCRDRLRFWAVAAKRNSSFAPHGPRNRNRPNPRIGANLIAILATPNLLNRIPVEGGDGQVLSFLEANCPGLDAVEVESLKGVPAKYFLSANDVVGTGVTFHIGHLLAGGDNGTELKRMTEAICAIPEVVEQLPIVKSIKSQLTTFLTRTIRCPL